jgi:plastocyanin
MAMSYPRSRERRWRVTVTAAAAAGTLLLAACGSASGSSALATIAPGSGHALAGFPGTSGSPSELPTAMPTSMAGMASTAPPGSAAVKPVAADAVTIHNFAFGPQIVTVKTGMTVHWTNQDSEAHTVTSDAGAFNSPVLQPGASFSFTFTKPGTYSYHCSIHPFMTGKVVVS